MELVITLDRSKLYFNLRKYHKLDKRRPIEHLVNFVCFQQNNADNKLRWIEWEINRKNFEDEVEVRHYLVKYDLQESFIWTEVKGGIYETIQNKLQIFSAKTTVQEYTAQKNEDDHMNQRWRYLVSVSIPILLNNCF